MTGGGASFRGRGRGAADSWDGKTPDKDAGFKSDRQKAKEREERDAQDAELDVSSRGSPLSALRVRSPPASQLTSVPLPFLCCALIAQSKFGFDPYLSTEPRTAFLFNMRASSLADAAASSSSSSSSPASPYACLDCYFVCEDGSTFKASVPHLPYFYLQLRQCSPSDYLEAESYLLRRYEGVLLSVSLHEMDDLSLPNHLSGLKRGYVRLSFRNVGDMLSVRNRLMAVLADNRKREDSAGSAQAAAAAASSSALDSHQLRQRRRRDAILDSVIDMREYDVPYVTRAAIDLRIRVGCWYDVALVPAAAVAAAASAAPASFSSSSAAAFLPSSPSFVCHSLQPRSELLTPPHLRKCTFDIETTKSPLKFPNAEVDNILMVSLMMDEQGFLIVNRDIVSADIADFEYSPSEEMQGRFSCINVAGERELLLEFFALVRQYRPLLFISYNGDFFDWPFIAARCSAHGLSLLQEAGVYQRDDEFVGKSALHLDCFCWVKRDSYLPQGSQGLKAVTRAKLQYSPVEVDPEQMLTLAAEQPQQLAAYSVSDAVATHFLYLRFVHLFVFSLATIIPMSASDVLRKGSGTLCESLLQVQAAAAGIIAPNKQEDELSRFHHGHLIDSETYSGGHVECIESGVFRSDIPVRFKLRHERLKLLRQGVTDTLRFAVEKEHGRRLEQLLNREEVEARVGGLLDRLLQSPSVDCLPLIYHLDVSAMYPNIILTNRLQPMAVVDESTCAACDFNVEGSDCQRRMEWKWRGKFFPATRGEVDSIRRALEYEANVATAAPAAATAAAASSSSSSARSAYRRGGAAAPATGAAAAAASASYNELPASAQSAALKAKVKAYSHRVYSKYTVESTESRVAIVCQRENSFYVDTVRAFRDRRYEYKLKGKQAKREADAAAARGERLERSRAEARLLVFDSLQLAHKCILNSFYGYVMRRGARWQSIEMAGVVTNTGAQLIREARELVDDIGRPLELDTDGIWCMLPACFPDCFELQWEGGGSSRWSYPCSLLNESVAARYTNTQYQELRRSEAADGQVSSHYERRSECSILFEVDGPYRAMVLPAAREEGRNIKKRYAVFAQDGHISELKGFELKRRGELKLIKVFQSALFDKFLLGSTLAECYAAVAAVCNQWLDVLLSRGQGMEDDDIIELISESRSMADTLDDYGDRRSTSISTARRLGQFLGPEMLTDRGLNCKFVIAAKPEGSSTSDRAIPTAIFAADEAVKRRFLRSWLRDPGMEDFDIRSLLDWGYYVSRLSAAIQKIVTIPAAMQHVPNPVERVRHPDWLGRRVRERDDSQRQMRIARFFHKKGEGDAVMDIEDVAGRDKGRDSSLQQQQQRQQAAVVKRTNTLRGGAVRLSADQPEDVEEADSEKPEAKEEEKQPPDDEEVMVVEQPAVQPEGQQEESEEAAAAAVAAQRGDEFSVWLTSRKQQWKAMKERKRKLRHAVPSSAPTAASAFSAAVSASLPSLTGGLHSYLQQSSASLLSTPWQIIQVTPELTASSSSPTGLYRFWIFLHPATLTSVSVRADRLFLLNSRVRLSGDSAHRRVERTLPRGRKANFLYEMRVDEREWREREAAYLDTLAEQSVEGMYETQVSPLFRLLRDVGCVCRPTVGRVTPGGEFDAAQLQYKTTTECGYLSSPLLYRGFLYSSQHGGAAQRAVFCLCFEQSADGLLVVVNGYGGETEQVNAGRLLRQGYREMRRKGKQEAGGQGAGRRRQRTAGHGRGDGGGRCGAAASLLHRGATAPPCPRPTLCCARRCSVTSSCRPTPRSCCARCRLLCLCCTCSCRPCARTSPWSACRSTRRTTCTRPSTGRLPRCQWRCCATCSAPTGTRLTSRSAAGAHLPIGNLEADVPCQLMDLMYARALQAGKHALWSSRAGGAEVELGGRWLEEERLLAEEEEGGGRRAAAGGEPQRLLPQQLLRAQHAGACASTRCCSRPSSRRRAGQWSAAARRTTAAAAPPPPQPPWLAPSAS